MRLCSFTLLSEPETVRVGAYFDDGIADLSACASPAGHRHEQSAMRRLISSFNADAVERAAVGPRIPHAEARLAPPVPDPSKIVAAPVNYVDHQKEMNESVHVDGLGTFLKAPSSLIGHGGTVRLPYVDRRFDQEGELALVIGREASHVDAGAALEYVFGYMALLDMTMRGGEDRSTRKSFDTFTPTGPYIVTADEVGPPEALGLECSVNGVLRQRAKLTDLIWSVPRLIEYASSVMRLLPGDVITTGTPAGVGEVHDGDTIQVRIDRLGVLDVSVSAAAATVCPTRGAGRGPVPPPMVTPPSA